MYETALQDLVKPSGADPPANKRTLLMGPKRHPTNQTIISGGMSTKSYMLNEKDRGTLINLREKAKNRDL